MYEENQYKCKMLDRKEWSMHQEKKGSSNHDAFDLYQKKPKAAYAGFSSSSINQVSSGLGATRYPRNR